MATVEACGGTDTLERFDLAERALHWANAVLFGVLVLTGAALYVGPLSTIVGRRDLMRTVHLIAGLLLPVPVLATWLGPWRSGFRRDVGVLNRWDADDRKWLRSFGRDVTARLGKFNPGQKLNAAFTGGAIVVMLATGSVMHWFHPFPLSWRTGATFVHDWLAVSLFVVITGHIGFAVSDSDSLRSMVRGWVPARWAQHHHPRWLEELELEERSRTESQLTRSK